MPDSPSMAAIEECRSVFQAGFVLARDAVPDRYFSTTTGGCRNIVGVVLPNSLADACAAVRIATKHSAPLYPISTGHNWGYGEFLPVADGCIVLDLSRMNRIVDFDRELGIVTLEPGVTQGMLRTFLDRNAPEWLVPVHGGGPDCSVVGTALERGYGITPYADHFGAVMAIEAVLPGGEVYRSALADLGSPEADRTFKWGIGPYLDGIFTQGNFGVVTQMTVALAKVPEKTQAFFFWVKQDAQLEAAVAAIRAIISSVGGSLGSINLMNTQRVLSMMIPYPREHVPSGSVMSAALVAEMARRHRVPAWTGVGSLYGPRRIVAACRPEIRKRLRGIAAPLIFLTPTLVHRARNLLAYVPGSQNFRLATLLRTLDRTLQLMAGAPSQIALPLAYWKSGTIPPNDQPMDPACDGCGLLWYSPLVPMKPERVRAYVEFVRELTTQNGIEPLITLTSLSDRCFDSTVPLLFDRGLPEETARAHQCYLDLFRRGQQKGFLPYRVGVDHMRLIVDPNKPFWGLARKIKDAVDPQGIIAPGRYSATTGTQETLTP